MGLKVDPPVLIRPKTPEGLPEGGALKEREHITISGKTYDITDFSKRHPGGAWISKFKGQDVTCLFESFHPKSGPANKMLKALETTSTGDVLTPSPRHEELNSKYLQLCADFETDGFFTSPIWFIAATMMAPAVFMLLALFTTEMGYPVAVCGLLFGIGYGLTGYSMHHAGHLGVTGVSSIDHKLQAFTLDWCGGLYAPWWRVRHNRHHAAPNDPEVDPDLETAPLLLWHKDLLSHRKYRVWNNKPIVKYVLAVQRHLFFVYLAFYTYILHFGSRRMAAKDALDAKKRVGTMGNAFNYFLAIAIVMCSSQPCMWWVACWMVGQGVCGIYLGWIFALNHFSMPLASKTDHFCETVLHTTLNVRYSIGGRLNPLSRVLDFATGYLGYQVEHHLFPRMPACNYPLVHDRVKAWVEENKIAPFVDMDAVRAHAFMVHQFAPAPW
jgi:fatty acid desaturase